MTYPNGSYVDVFLFYIHFFHIRQRSCFDVAKNVPEIGTEWEVPSVRRALLWLVVIKII